MEIAILSSEPQEEPRKEVRINPFTGHPSETDELRAEAEKALQIPEEDGNSIISEAEDELSFTDYMRFIAEDLHGIRGSLKDMTTLQREHNVLMRRLYKTIRSLSMILQKGGGGAGEGGEGGEGEGEDVSTDKK